MLERGRHMGPGRAALTHGSVCLAILLLILIPLTALGYIDLSVILHVYLPVALMAVAAGLFGQFLLGYFLAASASLGLAAEYAVHLLQEHPTMGGAFLNTAILVSGVVVGMVVQITANGRRRRREWGPRDRAESDSGVP